MEDEFIVMPNHIHGIVWIEENDDTNVGARRAHKSDPRVGAERRSAPTNMPRVMAGSLGAIVRAYKSAVTYAINELRGTRGALIWQRNYYDHVIRNQADHERIYNYIQFNPFQWAKDEENPEWQNHH